MGLFNQFPFTNFHEANLDWLITNVNNIGMKKTDVMEEEILKMEAK